MQSVKGVLILPALLRIVAAVLLFSALGRHPYSYYQVLRVVVCAVSAHSAYLAYQLSRQGWLWFFVGVAVLFNPLLPVHLSREAWAVINLAVAGAFLSSVFFFRTKWDESTDAGRTLAKDPATMAMVRKRLQKLSPEGRSEIARRAAQARWARAKAAE